MVFRAFKRWDPLALVAVAIAAAMLAAYVVLIGRQHGEVAVWFLAGLAAATLAGGYGVVRVAPRRRPVLVMSAVVLMLLGVAGLLSIGFPILCAGVLMLVAGVRPG